MLLKPIFHCNAKPFALGTFALPNAKDTNMLGNAHFSRHPMQNPNASQWNIGCVGYQTQISCVGHVHFMFFVLISFAFGTQRNPSFQWNMGFSILSLSFRLVVCLFNSVLRSCNSALTRAALTRSLGYRLQMKCEASVIECCLKSILLV